MNEGLRKSPAFTVFEQQLNPNEEFLEMEWKERTHAADKIRRISKKNRNQIELLRFLVKIYYFPPQLVKMGISDKMARH